MNEQQAKDLAIVTNCGQHLLALINNVLDYSKIESGTMDLIKESIFNPVHYEVDSLFSSKILPRRR